MIKQNFDIPSSNDVVLYTDGLLAKKACKHVSQLNTSNKVLLGVTQGIGNAILTTPLIKALTSMNMKVDILSEGLIRGAEKIFEGMDNVKVLKEDEIAGRIYLLGLQTMWPYVGLEFKVAQLRFAPDIHKLWKDNIPAHEVEVNMALAYSLKYTDSIPSLYCHYNQKNKHSEKTYVGIHICRQYNHQFHANRQLRNPLELGIKLHEKGYTVIIFGHKGAVTEEQKQRYPEFAYVLGNDLSDVAGYIREIDCMVNEDSGIMHVTAAMDTPQIAIFGPTSHVKNKPWSDKAWLVRRDKMECQPCQYKQWANDCYKNECMDFGHDYITKQVELILDKYKPE